MQYLRDNFKEFAFIYIGNNKIRNIFKSYIQKYDALNALFIYNIKKNAKKSLTGEASFL